MEHTSAILSAFREEYTNKENYERNRKLKADLLSKGYGVAAVKLSEQSLFVVNLKDDKDFNSTIANLGHEWEQDSVLIIPKDGKDAYLYGSKEELETYDNLSKNSKWALKKMIEEKK